MGVWTTTKRILRSGSVGFWRNAFISFTSVLVMAIALFMIASTLFNEHSLEVALSELQNKVDINVYFHTEAKEEDIFALRTQIEGLAEVEEVTYLSRSDALKQFRERHEGDELTIQALDELGENPLGASVGIRAKETSQYESIANFLEQQRALEDPSEPLIDRVNYFQNKGAIDRLTDIINQTRNDNTIQAIALVFIAVLVSFNTIRLAIHSSREEISVMRLVGASNFYISSPFVIAGVMQGIIAGVLILIVLYPALKLYEGLFYPFPFFDESGYQDMLFNYYVTDFSYIFAVVIGSGIAIGALSSFMAVRRYLKV